MNLPTSVEIKIVRSDGAAAQDMLTIDAFLSGCSVMEKMIAGTIPMSCQKIAHPVKRRVTSNAKIGDASPSKLYTDIL